MRASDLDVAIDVAAAELDRFDEDPSVTVGYFSQHIGNELCILDYGAIPVFYGLSTGEAELVFEIVEREVFTKSADDERAVILRSDRYQKF